MADARSTREFVGGTTLNSPPIQAHAKQATRRHVQRWCKPKPRLPAATPGRKEPEQNDKGTPASTPPQTHTCHAHPLHQ